MSARDDYPYKAAINVYTQTDQYGRMCDEIDRLRDLAQEVWEWDDGETLPGRIPELLDALDWKSTP